MTAPLLLDVTNCALKGGRGGIPRISRELYRALREVSGLSVEPVIWERQRLSYARPCFFHTRNLAPDTGAPSRQNHPLVQFLQKRWRIHTRGQRLISPEKLSRSLLVLTELFSDARIEWLIRYRAENPGARIAAIFYDAIPWTHAALTPELNQANFKDYMAALASCDVVLCISGESRDDLRRFWASQGIAPARTEVLYCPLTTVAASRHETSPPVVPAALREQPVDDPFILFVSSLEPRKNHRTLLQACETLWKENTRFDLVLVGQRLPGHSEPILAEIERLRDAGRPISWFMGADDDLLHHFYRRSAFTVYPSLKEGFGLPILESLAFGKPCICSGTGAIGEVAAGGGCLQVDVADPEALAGAIRTLLQSPGERDRLAAEAKHRRYRTWVEYTADLLRACGELP